MFISNVGNAELELLGLELHPIGSNELAVVNPGLPLPIPSLGVIEVIVEYAPHDIGVDVGTVEIVSNDPDEPVTSFSLEGSGFYPGRISVIPQTLEFGPVEIGESAARMVWIENYGLGPLTISKLEFEASTNYNLDPSNPTLPIIINPGEFEELIVNYTPSDVEADIGWLQIFSNDPDERDIWIDLSGEGFPPVVLCNLDINQSELEFEEVLIGTTMTLMTTIQNIGEEACELSEITQHGSLDFKVNPPSPSTPYILVPEGWINLYVEYTPSGEGFNVGAIKILSNDPDEPEMWIDLVGDGKLFSELFE
jgi:hypothetical protein